LSMNVLGGRMERILTAAIKEISTNVKVATMVIEF